MNILFAGTPEVALPTLRALIDSNNTVVGVLTRPPARKGRKATLVPSPVATFASECGIPLIETSRPSDEDTLEHIKSLAPDLGVVVAYGAILKKDVLTAPRLGWINLHFSDLPRWRGAAPVQHAIWNRDAEIATSVFQLDEGLDTGPVYSRQVFPLYGDETSGALLESLSLKGASQVVNVVNAIDQGEAPVSQPVEGATYARQLSRSDGFIDFSESPEVLDAHIRAVTPAPGAWTTLRGTPMKLGPITPLSNINELSPGQVSATKKTVLVGCRNGAVRLGEVAPAGKKWMASTDWARGARVGDVRLGEVSL